MGDFNLHHDNLNDKHVRALRSILDVTGLQQHVTQTTHKGGHILNYVITRLGCDLLADLEVLPRRLSDHNAISSQLHLMPPSVVPRSILCGRIRNIDHAQFAVDLAFKMSAPI